jgi:hypothetical protein
MPWKANVLVVANVTAISPELEAALRARAERSPATFTMLVPAAGAESSRLEAAALQLHAALERLREAGLEIDGQVGDTDPILAVAEVFTPTRFDEAIVSTLPPGVSQWLQVDLPHRIEKMTGLPTTHVVAQPPVIPLRGTPPAAHERLGLLAPLQPLTWGAKKRA